MKCRIDFGRPYTPTNGINLTINQVVARYITGKTPAMWVEICKMTLNCLNKNNGEWIWPDAKLVFTRHGDLYDVKAI